MDSSPRRDGDDDNKGDTPSLSSTTPSSTPTTTPTPDLTPREQQADRQYLEEDFVPPASSTSHDLTHTYSWDNQLADPSFVGAPVTAFHHAPMSDGWDNIIVGMKVEVENADVDPMPGVFTAAYWVATVLRISGYKVLLRYEGFGQDGSKDFWLNLCSDKVHPVGWCATKGKPLIPPKTIQSKYSDWKEFLVKRLTGARTLPINFYKVVWESVSSVFRKGMKLEVVDKMRISQVRVASVVDITGRRLQLSYDDSNGGEGFWCHEESPLIHPVGWARRVGHQIAATSDYHDRCLMENLLDTDTTPDMFPEYPQPSGVFTAGMKLEAVDPLNLATVCVATVMKVLRFGYIMIRIDGYETDPTGGDWFCYHTSSPFIFPPGFCDRNNIKLKVPAGFEGSFNWIEYLASGNSKAAPVSIFPLRDNHKHAFKAGMKVECTDLMDPRLVCVSTVNRVVGHLLKVHFDGWEEDYDQWMDCDSVDIYPVGWCELVGHRLEGPRMQMPLKNLKNLKKDRKRKAGNKRTGKMNKKRVPSGGGEGEEEDMVSRSPTPTLNAVQEKLEPSPVKAVKTEDVKSLAEDVKASTIKDEEDVKASTLKDDEDVKAVQMQEAPKEVIEKEKVQAMEEEEEEEIQEEEEEEVQMYIPRLLDAAGNKTMVPRDSVLDVLAWTVGHVTQFLEINECGNQVPAFKENTVNGEQLMSLTKGDLMRLANNKIGPCLKIENLQALLKARMSSAQARLLTRN